MKLVDLTAKAALTIMLLALPEQGPAQPAGPGPVRTSTACHTPTVICYLPSAAPVGTACWCATPSGPVSGKIQ